MVATNDQKRYDDDAARLIHRHSLCPTLEELHAETQRLYDDITARAAIARARDARLKRQHRRYANKRKG